MIYRDDQSSIRLILTWVISNHHTLITSFFGLASAYYVVRFTTDEAASCIPAKLLVTPPPTEDKNACEVQWIDGEIYDATVNNTILPAP